MASASDIPKIQTDSKDDVRFLIKQIQDAAAKATAKRLAAGEKIDDKTRQATEKLVKKWVEDVFKLAGGSIQINGQEYDKAFEQVDEIEPLDEVLHSKVQTLQAATEEATLRVMDRRKHVPQQVEQLMRDAVARQSGVADRVVFEKEGKTKEGKTKEVEEDPTTLSRAETIPNEYLKGLQMLTDLKKSIPANLAKLERAQTVVHDVLDQ